MQNQTISTKADTFLRMLNEDHVYLCRDLDFPAICNMLHADPRELDEELFNRTGHTAAELEIAMYSSYISYLSKKYGLGLVNAR